jgi:hypothetical protein
MRIFEHPNLHGFECPICKTSIDKPVTLVGIDGTREGNIQQAEQVHIECIELQKVKYDDKLAIVMFL